MGKDFPDGGFAYHPPARDDYMPTVVKVVPSMPASQSDRPPLRPVMPTQE